MSAVRPGNGLRTSANHACQSTSVPKQSKVTHRLLTDTTNLLVIKAKGPSPCSDDGPSRSRRSLGFLHHPKQTGGVKSIQPSALMRTTTGASSAEAVCMQLG